MLYQDQRGDGAEPMLLIFHRKFFRKLCNRLHGALPTSGYFGTHGEIVYTFQKSLVRQLHRGKRRLLHQGFTTTCM